MFPLQAKKQKQPAEDEDPESPPGRPKEKEPADDVDQPEDDTIRNAVDDFRKRLREGAVIRAAQVEPTMISLEPNELQDELSKSPGVEYVI